MGLVLSRSVFGLPRQKYALEVHVDSAEVEAAIDPDTPIIDPHHHLWDVRTQDKGWPVPPIVITILYKLNPQILVPLMYSGQEPAVQKFVTKFMWAAVPFMENEMLRDVENLPQSDQPLPVEGERPAGRPRGHNVRGTVYVESGWDDPKATSHAFKAIPEAGMAQAVAFRTGGRLCSGIVAHVPLTEGIDAIRPALKKLVESCPNVRGIRHEIAYREGMFPLETRPKLAYDEKFRSCFAALKEFDLTFDTWLYHDQINDLRDLAIAFPDVTIVCDHMAYPVGFPPYDRTQSFEEWKPLIKELAETCPNVVVKLSGLGSAVVGFGYENRKVPPNSEELADAWGPYVRHCIECFGVRRCLFASNFPVDKVSCSYTALFNAFKRIVNAMDGILDEDKSQLFYGNAARIYRLNIDQ